MYENDCPHFILKKAGTGLMSVPAFAVLFGFHSSALFCFTFLRKVVFCVLQFGIFHINQIAHRANITDKVYKEDIDEIKELGNKLWQPLLYLQSKVLQLKR